LIFMHRMLHNYRSVILLDGSMPSQAVLDMIDWDKRVVAADGAIVKAMEYNIKVDYLVGDLDGHLIKPRGVEVHHNPDQDSCDFGKCIDFIRHKNLAPSMIIGINGGEIDHIISNIHIMVKHHQQDGEYFFLDSDGKGGIKFGLVLTESHKFASGVGKNVSIFPYPDACISTNGLQYPLNKTEIKQFEGILCSRNKTVDEEIEIIIHRGMVLVVLDL